MMILDGSIGQELVNRAGKATDLWSIQALLDAPEMVRDVHDEYFSVGAEIATTNTYSVLPDRLDPKGLGHQFEPLQIAACTMAAQARDAHGSGLVGGSMGPLGFTYQPDKAPPAERSAEVYERVAKLQADYVDMYMLETMSSVEEALGGLMGTAGLGKPVWVSLSVDDTDGTKLRSGEPLKNMLPVLAEYKPEAVLINCSLPEAVTQGIPELSESGLKIGAYANGFTGIHDDFNSIYATVDVLKARTDLDAAAYLEFAKIWAGLGATLIGGCCEVGPAHIAALSKHFKAT